MFDKCMPFISTLVVFLALVSVASLGGDLAHADVELPDRRYLFEEDRNERIYEEREKQSLKFKRAIVSAKSSSPEGRPLNVEATNLEFDTDNNKIKASGDVFITYSSVKAESSSGVVDTVSNEAELDGNVRIDDVDFDLTADSAAFNLDTGAGTLKDVDLTFEQGDYRLRAQDVRRFEGDIFELRDVGFSTCECPDGDSCLPWEIKARKARIQREGYGQAWDATINVHDVPVLYVPYLAFPAKRERQSGLLPFTFGGGGESGFSLEAPFFWAIDHSTDATFKAIYESSTRAGLDTEFRKVFSLRNDLEANFVYLNDSFRDGDLQGTNIDDLNDPTFDDNRFGGYIDHVWSGEVGPLSLQWILDAHFVSDDLFPREYEKEKIADYNSRFVTSTAVLRAPLGSSTTVDLSAEYNQAIVDDDDFVFQRLPELEVFSLNVFRPFGENPLGLKLVSRSTLSSVNFSRDKSFEGMRNEAYQYLALPFYYKNYFDGTFNTSVRASHYNLSETEIIDQSSADQTVLGELDSSSNRVVPAFIFELGTVFEKVFEVPERSALQTALEMGRRGRAGSVKRLKHTIEPELKYQYVPFVDQSDNPQFDSLDRLAQKNVLTYGLTQRIYGRYEPRKDYVLGIEETTPELSDLGNLRAPSPLGEAERFGLQPNQSSAFQPRALGEVRELMRLELYQSLDINEERKDEDPNVDTLSDLFAKLVILPNEYFGMALSADYNFQDQDFSAYSIEGQFRTKRGDRLINRLRFIDQTVRQLETNVEIKLTDTTRLAYYSRYDDLASEFIEQKGGVRFSSNCNCWTFDLTLSDRINPDETEFAFTLTLVGLGEIGNTFAKNSQDGN